MIFEVPFVHKLNYKHNLEEEMVTIIIPSHTMAHTHMYIKSCAHMHLAAHWFMFAGHSIEINNIGMLKLAHESCLLKELDSVLGTTFVQRLQSNFNIFFSFLPYPSLNSTKTTSSKMACHPTHVVKLLSFLRYAIPQYALCKPS